MALDEAIIKQFIASAGQHHFLAEPPAYLDCSICQTTFQEPVCCPTGAHTFCRRCLTDWMGTTAAPHCPIDREAFRIGEQPRRAPQALIDCIDALEVTCALGCGWTGGQGRWPDHLRRDCPEVEDDAHEDRQIRAGSVPLALRGLANVNNAVANIANVGAVQPEPLLPNAGIEARAEEQQHQPNVVRTVEKLLGSCDTCQRELVNETYKCLVCPDFDICTPCWFDAARDLHTDSHAFVRLTDRSDLFPGDSRGQAETGQVHRNITCDGCNRDPIVGIRWHCVECEDFDLCDRCMGDPAAEYREHRADHNMLRLVKPRQDSI